MFGLQLQLINLSQENQQRIKSLNSAYRFRYLSDQSKFIVVLFAGMI